MKKVNLILFLILFSKFSYAECKSLEPCLKDIQKINENSSDLGKCPDQNEIETKSFQKRKFDKDSWKYALAGVTLSPGIFILGTAIHEGSHCIAAELQEFDCVEVRVIPYKDEENDYFYFGSMKYRDPQGLYTPEKDAVVTIAPMITNVSLISAYSTLAFSNKLPKNKWAKTAAFALGATQVVDLMNHFRNDHPRSDSGKYISFIQQKHNLEYEKAFNILKGPQLGFAIVGASALAIEGYRIFTVPKKNSNELKKIQIIPSATPQGFHLGVNGRF